ncbi:MAG: hypothetical protein ACOY8P_00100 [Thermodesulfobacteriota bacterium]
MKKGSLFCGLIGSALVLGTAPASYGCPAGLTCGPATVYEVTVHSIELCTGTDGTSCEGAAVVGQGARTFDIASVAVGAEVGSYATISNLQVGTTYTHARVTVDTSFDIRGTTPDPGAVGNVCNTEGTAGTVAVPATVAGGGALATSTLVLPQPGALAGAITAAGTYTPLGIVHNGTTLTMVGPLPAPITITTQAPSIDIAFDTSEGLGSADVGGLCALFPAPPDVVITLN